MIKTTYPQNCNHLKQAHDRKLIILWNQQRILWKHAV